MKIWTLHNSLKINVMKNLTFLFIAVCMLLVTSPLSAGPKEINSDVKIDIKKSNTNIKFYQEGAKLGFNQAVKFLKTQDVCDDNMALYKKHVTNARIMAIVAIITMPIGVIILIAPIIVQQKKWANALAGAVEDYNNNLGSDQNKLKKLTPEMFSQ